MSARCWSSPSVTAGQVHHSLEGWSRVGPAPTIKSGCAVTPTAPQAPPPPQCRSGSAYLSNRGRSGAERMSNLSAQTINKPTFIAATCSPLTPSCLYVQPWARKPSVAAALPPQLPPGPHQSVSKLPQSLSPCGCSPCPLGLHAYRGPNGKHSAPAGSWPEASRSQACWRWEGECIGGGQGGR